MGLIKPYLPPYDLETWNDRPHLERMRLLAQDWAANGMGTPYSVHLLYTFKLVAYVLGGAAFIAGTSGIGGVWEFSDWWREPIVYQKAIVWTMLFEILGFGASSGPLAFRFLPPVQACLNWLKPGTVRLPPWGDKVPGTAGETRSIVDMALYLAIVVVEVLLLLSDGVQGKSGLPDGTVGTLDLRLVGALVGLLAVAGLRDKMLFLASRGEQYWVMCVLFLTFSYVDMIVALKLVMCAVWLGAAFSKLGKHFTFVVPAMLSNAPLQPKRFKKKLYRNHPDDLRPSRTGFFFAHVGTAIESIIPLVLLFSGNKTLTVIAVAAIAFFHLFIVSAFPLAVPLEWNILYMFSAFWLFYGHGAWDGFGLGDMAPALAIGTIVVLAVFPVLGNLRPDLVSFLPSARYYAGNWATSQWAFRRGPTKHDGAEHRINLHSKSPAKTQYEQISKLYGPGVAEIFLQKCVAWRSMHSHGRALSSLIIDHVDDPQNYDIREGEFVASTVLGWQFGDGHLHDEQFITELQRRCGFAPGDCIVVYIESEPFGKGTQHYRVHDLGVGLIDEGYVRVDDLVDVQGWLPDGRIPTHRFGDDVATSAATT